MDFDGDDPLDDLLRDTSADKFKSAITTRTTDTVTPNPPVQETRKERKSALLAELFGSGPSSGFALNDIRDDAEGSANKPSSSLSAVRSDIEPASGTFLSSGSKTFRDSTDEKGIDSVNFSPARSSHFEVAEKKDSDVSLGGYVPSIGKSPVVSSISGSKSRPSSSPNSLATQFQNTSPAKLLNSTNLNSEFEKISTSSFSAKLDQNTETFRSSFTQPKSIFQEERKSIFTSPAEKTSPEIPVQSSYSPAIIQPVQNVQVDSAIISSVKDSIEKFSDGFFSRLETLSEKAFSVTEISCGLNELQKCLLSISQCLVASNAQADRVPLNTDVEKRLLNMENRLDALQQENVTLKSRLEILENLLRDHKHESFRIKTETEASVETKLKPLKESVNSLENKWNAQSTLFQSVTNETNQNLRSFENWHGKIQMRLDEIERRQSEKVSKGYCDEIQLLLQNELKWLRQQKDKLKKNRKDNQLGFQEVHGKINLLDQFAMELSRTVREHQFNLEITDDRLRKLEKKWSTLTDQKDDHANEPERTKGKANQVEDIGMALWKLQVKSDEQKLIEQQNFLQCVARSPI